MKAMKEDVDYSRGVTTEINETMVVVGEDTKIMKAWAEGIKEDTRVIRDDTKHIKEETIDMKEDLRVTREKVEKLTEAFFKSSLVGELYLFDSWFFFGIFK